MGRPCGEVQPPPRTRVPTRRWLCVCLFILALVACSPNTHSLERIQDAGVLRVAIDPSFPPFEYVDSEGQIVGFDADLAQALARGLGVESHFVTTGYDALFDALTVGHADIIISALYPDPSRSGGYAFSRPYFDAGHVLVAPVGADLTSIAELSGRTVACIFGTEGHMEALRWRQTLKPPPVVLTFDDPISMTTMLVKGSADTIVIDRVSAEMIVAGDGALQILAAPITSEPYVAAARREDIAVIEAVDAILDELDADGTLEALTSRWMRSSTP